MRRVAEQVEGGVILECGHWIPDEKPDWIAREIIHFDAAQVARPAPG